MPFLRLYSGKTLQQQWELGANCLTIGRAPDNDIVLQHPAVSNHHAHIETDGHQYILVDDASTNGVFVNTQKISRHTLTFWDEIQIHSYKLVFMSTARLAGETASRETTQTAALAQSGTVVMQTRDLDALRKKLEQARVAYLLVVDSGVRILLDKARFTLGRGRECDLRCGGWFAPKLAATIQQQPDAHYILPAKRVRVFVNGEYPCDPVRLVDNSDIKLQGLTLKYYLRPLDESANWQRP
ncbi:FHA domain-containing protein [Allochromatium warmingii]|uniref:FHA domain-containing protein n=1 Tax=Allochromatium warmingii TaxID=61595 RepID=A0A1H3EYE6_ALLWA|nr:FHA domain-containing protein [Allochromatium warmingii]SDX83843.1 FHA domain-containing protein [Allochromatium warmingii]